ncbi:MAG: hypothetical protein LBF22_05670 [Deltaproteobacteria bacterium]|jgi:hypothetical protein|nr:hypothetical protein [Deltaproteobacteria bacterium]
MDHNAKYLEAKATAAEAAARLNNLGSLNKADGRLSFHIKSSEKVALQKVEAFEKIIKFDEDSLYLIASKLDHLQNQRNQSMERLKLSRLQRGSKMHKKENPFALAYRSFFYIAAALCFMDVRAVAKSKPDWPLMVSTFIIAIIFNGITSIYMASTLASMNDFGRPAMIAIGAITFIILSTTEWNVIYAFWTQNPKGPYKILLCMIRLSAIASCGLICIPFYAAYSNPIEFKDYITQINTEKRATVIKSQIDLLQEEQDKSKIELERLKGDLNINLNFTYALFKEKTLKISVQLGTILIILVINSFSIFILLFLRPKMYPYILEKIHDRDQKIHDRYLSHLIESDQDERLEEHLLKTAKHIKNLK